METSSPIKPLPHHLPHPKLTDTLCLKNRAELCATWCHLMFSVSLVVLWSIPMVLSSSGSFCLLWLLFLLTCRSVTDTMSAQTHCTGSKMCVSYATIWKIKMLTPNGPRYLTLSAVCYRRSFSLQVCQSAMFLRSHHGSIHTFKKRKVDSKMEDNKLQS